MIPRGISRAHIEQAIGRIVRDDVPRGRRSRGYCLVTEGRHLPPKYTIALAHQVATGELLDSDRFSGGPESNEFLRRRGFAVVECNCRGTVRDGSDTPVSPPLKKKTRRVAAGRHSERCRTCKVPGRPAPGTSSTGRANSISNSDGRRASKPTQELPSPPFCEMWLACWRDIAATASTRSCGETCWRAATTGCRTGDSSSSSTRASTSRGRGSSPSPRTRTRIRSGSPLGAGWSFATGTTRRTTTRRSATNNAPGTTRCGTLSAPTQGFQPTVRLYARDLVWCSLDPDSPEDRERFADLIDGGRSRARRTTVGVPAPVEPSESTVRVAMVFPPVAQKSSNGVPPSGPGAQQPDVPTAEAFAGEAVDFVLFPEGYVSATDRERSESLSRLAADLDAPLLVGAIDTTVDSTGRAWQVLLRFDPDGSRSRVYEKHSTADAVAFEQPDWEPTAALPTLPLGGIRVGATICHDHYLGLLPRFLARNGAHIWVNPSFDNVTAIKWSSILRLRAVENSFYALCTLHYDVARKRTHPFGFAPDGTELLAKPAGWGVKQPLSECSEAGSIYVVDLDMAGVGKPLDWSKIPPADKPRAPRERDAAEAHPRGVARRTANRSRVFGPEPY